MAVWLKHRRLASHFKDRNIAQYFITRLLRNQSNKQFFTHGALQHWKRSSMPCSLASYWLEYDLFLFLRSPLQSEIPHHSFPLSKLLEIKLANFFPISRWIANFGCAPSVVPSTVNPSTRSQIWNFNVFPSLASRRLIREGNPTLNSRFSVSLSGKGGWQKLFTTAVEENLIYTYH